MLEVPKSRMALSDAVVYAAATLKNTGSLIENAFDDFLSESEISLPEAEDVTYEDRLGYSSWVAGRRVLVGNRQGNAVVFDAAEFPPFSQQEKRIPSSKSIEKSSFCWL